jgi:hypothetical protein
MNQRTLLDRLPTPAAFGLVLLLFLLPFATVSCGVEDATVDASFTGLDLMAGGEPSVSGPNVDPDTEEQLNLFFQDSYDTEPLAILAAVLLLAGLASALLPTAKIRSLAAAGIAALTTIVLAVTVFLRLPSRVDDAIANFRVETQLAEDIPHSTTGAFGFWIAVVVLIALALWQGYEALFAKAEGPPPDPVSGRLETPSSEGWTTGNPPLRRDDGSQGSI